MDAIKHHLTFWLHIAGVVFTWFMPFVLPWPLAVTIYATVIVQFAIFGKCLMNEHHGLTEQDDLIFYSDVMERMGLRPNRRLVKNVVRRWLYPSLIIVTLLWQVLGQHKALLQF
jgi:hypothetical protein